MITNRSPAMPTFGGKVTLSVAAVATAASIAFPPCIRIRAPAIAAKGWTVVTIPFRAMTSERVCGTHPSARSPRTALHQEGVGISVHILTGGDCATAKLELSSTPAVRRSATRQIRSRRRRRLRPMVSPLHRSGAHPLAPGPQVGAFSAPALYSKLRYSLSPRPRTSRRLFEVEDL